LLEQGAAVKSRNIQQSPFACVMTAIDSDKRETHLENARKIFGKVEQIRELQDGYAFRLPQQPLLLEDLARFINLERLCCPFFGFVLDIQPEGGDVWLNLTGREGVKPFIRAEIGEFLGAVGF
jgi:hypothetical protein